MSDINVTIPGGERKRLKTAGKYCESDIVVTAEGGDTEAAFEAGRKAEYDAFWDSFQQNGNRTNYTAAFGAQWTADTFKPKYPIRPTAAAYMFFNNDTDGLYVDDFVKHCEDNNIILDFSNCTSVIYALSCIRSRHFGVIDLSNCTNSTDLFYGHDWKGEAYGVQVIDEIISTEKTVFSNTVFKGAKYLREVKFSGVIASNISIPSEKLSRDSITSVINALSDTTTGMTITLSKTATEAAFTAEEWSALVATKPNWTISLA